MLANTLVTLVTLVLHTLVTVVHLVNIRVISVQTNHLLLVAIEVQASQELVDKTFH